MILDFIIAKGNIYEKERTLYMESKKPKVRMATQVDFDNF